MPQAVSDHDLISGTASIKKPKQLPHTRTFRHLASYNKDLCVTVNARKYTFNQLLETDDINVQIGTLNDIFFYLNSFVPIVTKEVTRPSTQWFNNDLSVAIQKRNDLSS